MLLAVLVVCYSTVISIPSHSGLRPGTVMSAARYVIVDDTNPSIGYTGPWFAVDNTQTDIGFYGPAFRNTLHGVTGTGNVKASLFFAFNGMFRLLYCFAFTTLSLYRRLQDQKSLFTGQT